MRPWLTCVLAALAAACGSVANNPDANGDGPGDDDPDDGAVSGTRLKLKWIDFGGTRAANGQHDSMRGEDCYAYEWNDGGTYCTPSNAASIGYTDAACTQRVGYTYTNPDCPAMPPDYFLEFEQLPCSYDVNALFPRGSSIAGTQYYFLDGLGNCNGPNADPNVRYYSLGAQVPSSALVALTYATPVTTGRYAHRFYESADGARVFAGHHDTQLDTGCYMQRTTDAATTGACFPNAAYYAGYYGDSTCTSPKMSMQNGCPAPDYMMHYPSAVCPEDSRPRFYSLGAPGANPLFQGDTASCSAVTPDPNQTYYGAGTLLAVPDVPWSVDTAVARRIQLAHYDDNGTRIRDFGLYDTEHDQRCYTYTTPSGSVVCMPFSASVSDYYSDPACGSPIMLVDIYSPSPTCDPPALPGLAYKYIPANPGTCDYRYDVYTVGAMYTGQVYQNFGTCEQDTRTDLIRYRAGTLVPLSQLGQGTEVTDP